MSSIDLEKASQTFLLNPSEDNEINMLKIIVEMIVKGEEVIIDGKKVVGGIDPAIIVADTDNRNYFKVYTSKDKFDECQGKEPFVLPIDQLLSPSFDSDAFGGLALNYKQKEECVLVPKETILQILMNYQNNNA